MGRGERQSGRSMVGVETQEGMGDGACTNQELAGDEDEHAVVGRGLGVEGRDLVLDLLEGEALWNAKKKMSAPLKARPQARRVARKGWRFEGMYRELLDDGVDTEDGGRLKGQHGLGPLFHSHALAASLEERY